MLMTSSIISQSLTSIPFKSSYKSKTRSLYSSSNLSIRRYQTLFLGEKLFNITRVRNNENAGRKFAVFSSIQPGVPPPSEPSFQLLNWVLGAVVTIILPFFTHKWGSLLKFRNEVETAVETIEEIVEVVEKVAEGVEKVADDIADHLPEDGSLREAVDFVEKVAETVDKDAHLVGDLIDKVQEVEEKLDECVESLAEEAHEHRKQLHRAHEHLEQTKDEFQKI